MVQVMTIDLDETDARAEKIYDFVTKELDLPPRHAFAAMTAAIGFMMARAEDQPPLPVALRLFIESILLAYYQEREIRKTKPN